jgi:hypothetical protein
VRDDGAADERRVERFIFFRGTGGDCFWSWRMSRALVGRSLRVLTGCFGSYGYHEANGKSQQGIALAVDEDDMPSRD